MDNQLIGQLFGADRSHFAGVQRALDDGAEVLYAEEDGLCLKLKNSDIYMLYGCKDEGVAERAISFVATPSAVVCSNRSEVNAARDKFSSITKTKLCLQVRYEKPAGIECPEGIEVKKLPVLGEIVDFVTATYSLHYPREAIKKLMETRGMYGAYAGDELAGYIGSHEEGSIGLLEIMPDYRKRGIGSYLVDYMVEKITEKKEVAYSQIVFGNAKSLNMHAKMGFYPSDKLIYWCF